MIKFSKKGLSLLDVIIAVGLAVVGLVGIIGLLRYVVILGRANSDRFIAVNLAEEGIEIVRSYRDSHWQANLTYYSGSTFDFSGTREYMVDYRDKGNSWNNVFLPYNANTYLNIDAAGFYSYAAGAQTKFKRRIFLDPTINGTLQCTSDASANNDLGQCIIVVSEVKWGTNSLIVEDRLYNWKP